MISQINRQFEIPYNFDPQLITTIKLLDDPISSFVNCIYIPPYLHDYQTILRTPESANNLFNMTRKEYEKHIQFINNLYPEKIQLLLQNPNILMDEITIKYYKELGINKFCSGSIKQTQIIKDIYPNSNIIGSISMKISKEFLYNHPECNNLFDGFVLHFPYCKSLNSIKELPDNFYYLLLVNAYCNTSCKGTHHWFNEYKSNSKEIFCPGLLFQNNDWEKSALIRPMDLEIFDPYIKIYKLQDRGWPTPDIIRDFILYTSDYKLYPNIISDKNLYNYQLQNISLK